MSKCYCNPQIIRICAAQSKVANKDYIETTMDVTTAADDINENTEDKDEVN